MNENVIMETLKESTHGTARKHDEYRTMRSKHRLAGNIRRKLELMTEPEIVDFDMTSIQNFNGNSHFFTINCNKSRRTSGV